MLERGESCKINKTKRVRNKKGTKFQDCTLEDLMSSVTELGLSLRTSPSHFPNLLNGPTYYIRTLYTIINVIYFDYTQSLDILYSFANQLIIKLFTMIPYR